MQYAIISMQLLFTSYVMKGCGNMRKTFSFTNQQVIEELDKQAQNNNASKFIEEAILYYLSHKDEDLNELIALQVYKTLAEFYSK